MMLDFVIQGLYDIQIKTNKFCISRMYSCMCGVFILKKTFTNKKLEKLPQKKVEIPFTFLHYKRVKIKIASIKYSCSKNFAII
jgi:hypothetical protein